MGTEGIAAMAYLASQGRLKQLDMLNLSGNEGLTNQDINALARAIGARKSWKNFIWKGWMWTK